MRKINHKFGLIIASIFLHSIANLILADDFLKVKNVNFGKIDRPTHQMSKKQAICIKGEWTNKFRKRRITIASTKHPVSQQEFYLESDDGNKIFYTINFIDPNNKKSNKKTLAVKPNVDYGFVYRCWSLSKKKSKLEFIIPASSFATLPIAGTYEDELTVTWQTNNKATNYIDAQKKHY